MVPLILVTSNKKIMQEFVNSKLTIILGWVATISLVILNLQLIYEVISSLY